MNIETIDPGHRFKLPSLDGDHRQVLQFVKRCDPERPWRFPGNTDSYPGATLQFVIRALLQRLFYLQGQIWSLENTGVIWCLKLSLWLLEFRAARRHKKVYARGIQFATFGEMCPTCGHTLCDHKI